MSSHSIVLNSMYNYQATAIVLSTIACLTIALLQQHDMSSHSIVLNIIAYLATTILKATSQALLQKCVLNNIGCLAVAMF